jgi:CobQ-like glutamine amidotransferase family enzyme
MRIGLVFPDLLGTYGDRGNALILFDRCRRRGIDAEVVTVHAGEPVPASLDCYVIGGGEDHTEEAAASMLRDSPVAEAWRAGASIVAVCAGLQLLGTSLELGNGETVAGIGLVDATTRPGPVRRVGDVVLDSPDSTVGAVCGFENHLGLTTMHGSVPALGTIRADGRVEGVLQHRLLATYLHGPLLARNPALADHVLRWTVGELPELPTEDVSVALHDTLVDRFGSRAKRSTSSPRPRLRRAKLKEATDR